MCGDRSSFSSFFGKLRLSVGVYTCSVYRTECRVALCVCTWCAPHSKFDSIAWRFVDRFLCARCPVSTGRGPKYRLRSGQPPTRGPEDGETKTMHDSDTATTLVCMPLSELRQHHPERARPAQMPPACAPRHSATTWWARKMPAETRSSCQGCWA